MLDPEVVSHLLGRNELADQLARLSDRERGVLELMAQGLSNRAIADRLVIDVKTVETHIARILTKLDLHQTPTSTGGCSPSSRGSAADSHAASLGSVSTSLPMFPLNAVIFPGVSVPLNVFEDRYRALVHHLLRVEDPTQRVFGSVGIREGYEVGDHGSQSLFRVGCRVQLTEVESRPDGTFSIVAVGLDRIQLERLDTTGTFPVGHVVDRPETTASVPEELLERARDTFTAYRAALAEIRSDPYTGDLPQDPSYLSWTLAACAPLPLHERQALLEAEDASERLRLVTDLLRTELRAMHVFPSLPATDVARTRWSPN